MGQIPPVSYASEVFVSPSSNRPFFWSHDAKIEASVKTNNKGEQIYAYAAKDKIPNSYNYIGVLKEGDIFTFDKNGEFSSARVSIDEPQNPGKQATKEVSIVKCTLKKGSVGKLPIGSVFYILWDEKNKSLLHYKGIVPKTFDQVVLCDQNMCAGDILGFLGLYEIPKNIEGGLEKKYQLHLEIFTNETLQNLKKFTENQAKIDQGRKYLVIEKDGELFFASRPDDIVYTQPQMSMQPASPDNSASQQSASQLQASYRKKLKRKKVIPICDVLMVKDKNDQLWYSPDEEIRDSKRGWIKDKDPKVKVVKQHNWKDLGFEIVEESKAQGNGCLINDDYTHSSSISPNQMESAEFFKKIYEVINGEAEEQEEQNSNSLITPSKVIQVLRNQDLSETVNKIIGYHPTEWKKDSVAKKCERTEQLADPKEYGGLLAHEKERMEKSVFWDSVQELGSNAKAFHFHPIYFIHNMGIKQNPTKIALDAGHGGSGLTGGKYTAKLPRLKPDDAWDFSDVTENRVHEWEFNDLVNKFIAEELAFYQEIETLRVDDATGKEHDISLSERPRRANAWGAKHYIAIHHNAGGGGDNWLTAQRAVIIIQENDPRAEGQNALSHQIAGNAVNRVASMMSIPLDKNTGGTDGIKINNYQVMRDFRRVTDGVCIYPEILFMDSKKDIKILLYDTHKMHIENLRIEAKSIVAAFVEILGFIKH